jgi:hypothetical protein
MLRTRIRFLLCSALLAGACFAQTDGAKPAAPEEKFFHLDLVVKEVEGGKTINSRSYTMTISTEKNAPNASTRNGSRVPVSNGPGNLQMYEVGTNLDCRNVKEISTGLAFGLSADITSIASETGAPAPPVIRTVRWSSPVIVTLRKPTTVFTSDDPTSKRQFQLEVTATPIK